MYYLDSCICIDLMRGKLPATYELMKQSNPDMFALPAIVEAELRTGAEKSANPQKNIALLERFIYPYTVVPFDSKCAFSYGKIRAALERKGQKIGANDMLIAATAVANGAVLVTSNLQEFKRIPNLSLEYWEETES